MTGCSSAISTRTTLINFESAIRTLALALDNKKDQIDSGIRDLERLRRSYAIQTNAVAIAERRVEGEQLSLQAGRRTVRNVRDAQDVLLSSQDDLTSAIVSHLAARLQLLVDIGVLNTDLTKFWERPEAVTVALQPPSTAKKPTSPAEEEVAPPDEILKM